MKTTVVTSVKDYCGLNKQNTVSILEINSTLSSEGGNYGSNLVVVLMSKKYFIEGLNSA